MISENGVILIDAGDGAKMTDAQWFADKELKRDAAARALEVETDPKKQRSLRARRDRYKAMITMGPRRTSEASSKAARAARLKGWA
jgi:hypothetical protein